MKNILAIGLIISSTNAFHARLRPIDGVTLNIDTEAFESTYERN